MRLRRDHGPRAGMVNSVSSSISQTHPLAFLSTPFPPPPSSPERLCTPQSSLSLSLSLSLSPSLRSTSSFLSLLSLLVNINVGIDVRPSMFNNPRQAFVDYPDGSGITLLWPLISLKLLFCEIILYIIINV